MLSAYTTPRAIPLPHPGESYNPTFEDHQGLLAVEHTEALLEEEANKKALKVKDEIVHTSHPRQDAWETGYADEVGSGDEGGNFDEETVAQPAESVVAAKQKVSLRKTEKMKKRKQYNKMLEARIRAQSRLTKSQRHALSTLPRIASSLDSSSSMSLLDTYNRKTLAAQKVAAMGLSSLRSGPARVPKPKQAFLLSEELPESLRLLKSDGNLWNDWINSSQRRGRLQTEKKAFGRMMKQKGRGYKHVEKVKWRKFGAQ